MSMTRLFDNINQPVNLNRASIIKISELLDIVKYSYQTIRVGSVSLLEMTDILNSIGMIENIISAMKTDSGNQANASKQCKDQIKAFLESRAKHTLNSPLCYTLNPTLPMNQLCLFLAGLVDRDHPHQTLMPSVKNKDIYLNDIDEVKLGQFILTDTKTSFKVTPLSRPLFQKIKDLSSPVLS